MPKRTQSLSHARFASGEDALQVWSRCTSVLSDVEAVRELEVPEFPQEPDPAIVNLIKQWRRLNDEQRTAEWESNLVTDQARRQSTAKEEWMKSSFEALAARQERWELNLFEQAQAAGQIYELGRLSPDVAEKPFLLWFSKPYGSQVSAWSLARDDFSARKSFQLPFFDASGQTVQPLIDAMNRVKPLDARPLGLSGYVFDTHLWELTKDEAHYDEEELGLFFFEAFDKERQRVERLRRKFSGEPQPEYKREPIPESVRTYVWRRDGGRCTTCGSQERLEFDHVIPVSRGGSNTERNIHLLCEPCNRKKSNAV